MVENYRTSMNADVLHAWAADAQAELKELRETLTAVSDALDYLHGMAPKQFADSRKNAERYRWLRSRFDACAASCDFAGDDSGETWREVEQCNDAGPALDAAIDDAMAAATAVGAA